MTGKDSHAAACGLAGAEQKLPHRVLAALRQVVPGSAGQALHEPEFRGNEWGYVKECLDTGWVSSAGKFVDRFERDLSEYTGVKHAVAVVNGTAALHVSLLLAGVTREDEVLIPTLSFVATANAVCHCGALPHFVESDASTLGVDAGKLEGYLSRIGEARRDGLYNRATGRPIRALVPMHTFGHPVDLDPLLELCRRFGLVLVEDAAESLGSFYKGTHTGNHGLLAALSFNGNKTITTGGGGAVLTNDDELGRLARHITTTAKLPHPWRYRHDMVAFNYRMPNINAALGCAQMERLPELLEQKRTLAGRYASALAQIPGVELVREPEYARSNYWLQALLLDEAHAGERDVILELTNGAGLATRPAWDLLHTLPMFDGSPRMELAVAASLERRLMNIPSSSVLGG